MNGHIIGTAGHVDHGKTALIRALTGTDTTHLPEEKRRGVTVELGFARLELPGGLTAGIVDVPGHEKFVKNMLAGAGGMELALLVVAADEGFMPQTREHLDILSLLGTPDGIVVVTKSDLADEARLAQVRREIRRETEGSFLAEAPILCVSAVTGAGIPELKALLAEKLSAQTCSREALPARLPIDRVFSVEGFGTVVTGTLTEGTLTVGRTVMLYPQGLAARIRGLQVHGTPVDTACQGQRTAVNLAGVKREQVQRGADLAEPGSLRESLMLDVKLQVLPRCGRTLKNGSRLHIHHGAGAWVCKLILLDGEELLPGQEGYAQLRFTQPVAFRTGDRFVARFYSPLETVGGGQVLNCRPGRHRRFEADVLEGLSLREHGTPDRKAERVFREAGTEPLPDEEARYSLGMTPADFAEAVEELTGRGALLSAGGLHLHRESFDRLGDRLEELLIDYHRLYPLRAGLRREEALSRLLPRWPGEAAAALLNRLTEQRAVEEENRLLRLAGFRPELTAEQQKLRRALAADCYRGGFQPCKLEELRRRYGGNRELPHVLDALFAEKLLIPLTPEWVLHGDFLRQARKRFRRLCGETSPVTLGRFRDELGISRREALLILEYLDRTGFTRPSGEGRSLA